MHSREAWAVALAEDLARYAQARRHTGHRVILALALPLFAWAAIAVAWTIPVPPSIGRPGFWAVMALVGVFAAYWKRSRRLGGAMFVVLVLLCLLTHGLYQWMLPAALLKTGLLVALIAIIGLWLGQRMEPSPGRPSDLGADLFLGPAWLLDRLLHRLGI